MEKYQNKYRITSARLQTWDYGSNASYFITICTQNREHYFGEIENDEMQLNEIGKLAEQFWAEIPNHFPFIELGNFVVMPNHVHGILIIDKNDDGVFAHTVADNVLADNVLADNVLADNVLADNVLADNVLADNVLADNVLADNVETRQCLVSTTTPTTPTTPPNTTITTNEKNKTVGQLRFRNQGKNTISSIVGSYKSVVTKNAGKIHSDFAWQSRFHDHIIRNAASFERIQNYIANNPVNWKEDKFNS